jgi:hypothetical protein
MSISADNTHTELEIRIDAAAGQKLLETLDWPLRLDFQGDLSVQEITATPLPGDGETLDAVMDDVPIPDLVTDQPEPAQKRYQLQLLALSVVMPVRPQPATGRPLTLAEIQLQVQARFNVGMRAWGKWYWREISTPWINLTGREATLKLTADGSCLLALPELQQTQVTLGFNLWQWPLRFKFDLSNHINLQLAKLGPYKLLDFADMQHARKLLGKQAGFTIVDLQELPTAVLIRCRLDWI